MPKHLAGTSALSSVDNVLAAPVESLVEFVVSIDSPEVEDAVIAAIRDGRTVESDGVFAAWWS